MEHMNVNLSQQSFYFGMMTSAIEAAVFGDPAEKNRMCRMNHQHMLCFEHWSLVWDTDKAQNLHLLCTKENYIFICQLVANFMVQVEL